MTFTDIAPVLSTLLATVLALLVNYKLGQLKDRTENRTARQTEQEAFRDDLLARIKDYDLQIEKKDVRISALEHTIDTLRTDKYNLSIENLDLKRKNAELEDMLTRIEKKVFYRGETKKE